MRASRSLILIAAVVALVAPSGSRADQASETPPDDDATIAREQVRSRVESVIARLNSPGSLGMSSVERFHELSGELIDIGPAAVPFLIAEVEQPVPTTFNIAAYALGRAGTPEAVEALRKATQRADEDKGKFARARKPWGVYGLALAGEVEALRFLEQGQLAAGDELMSGMSLMELAAALTAPDSIPVLLDQLKRFPGDERLEPELIYTLRALGRIGGASVRDAVLPFLEHEHWRVRQTAVRTLGTLGGPSVADRLLQMLEDPHDAVKRAAGEAIEELRPKGMRRKLLARLEVEQEVWVRNSLYRVLAADGDESLIEAFRSHWGRDDALDRSGVVKAVAQIGSTKGLNLLRAALRDQDQRVAMEAVTGLGRIASPGATDALLAQLRNPSGNVAITAVEVLADLREPKSGPRIADLLLRGELSAPVTDPFRRTPIQKKGNALVALRYTEPLPDIREAIPVQSDPYIVDYLHQLVRQLTEIRERGNDVARWAELLADPEPVFRELARGRLAELGDAAAVAALVGAFDRAGRTERIEILRSLAQAGSAGAAPLLEKILLEPEYDAYSERHVRSMAAWAARRVGGAEMIDLLRRAAIRREGVDADVLVALALVEEKAAVELIRTYRVSRLRHMLWERGQEMERLDGIAKAVSAGRSIAHLDRAPDEIPLGHWDPGD